MALHVGEQEEGASGLAYAKNAEMSSQQLNACTRPVQAQSRPNSSMGGVWDTQSYL